MKLEEYKKEIADLLSFIQVKIENYNVMHYYDVNITSETFFAGLLNLVFGYNLKNLNNQQYNQPYVDLYDEKNKIYIQVTSQTTSKKIKDTIKGFETLDNISNTTKLFIFLLGKKPNYKTNFPSQKIIFNSTENIFDIKDIIKEIDKSPLEKLRKIKEYLEKNVIMDTKNTTICSEEETLIELIEVLTKKGEVLKNIPSVIDPEFKILKRFAKFSTEIKKQYSDYYIVYGKEYSNVVSSLIKDEVTLININNYLKSSSVEILRKNDDNPMESLKELHIQINELLSVNNKKYSDGAIRFFLIHQIIECNVFPNEVKQNENR